MQNKKQQKWWKRSLNAFLATALVASSISFVGPQQAKAASAEYVGPGGVDISDPEFVSYIDIEKSPEVIAGKFVLKDLAGKFNWNNTLGAISEQHVNGGEINFHQATDAKETGMLFSTTSITDIPFGTSQEREVFSVQKSGETGFPWELSKAGKNDVLYSDSKIITNFATNEVKTIESPTEKVTAPNILRVVSTSNMWALSINGHIQAHTPQTHNPNWAKGVAQNGFEYFGYGDYAPFKNGNIAEMLVFNKTLDDDERSKVNSYLALKYGITLKNDAGQPTDYIASDGVTRMWTASKNSGYGHRITGIGLDGAGGINQKQSKSQADSAMVTIALGDTVEALNKDNAETIENDLSFFTFSDNEQAATFARPLTKENEQLQHTERIYKVEKTNWTDADITLQVDKVVGASEWPLYLVISADEQFDKNDSFYPLTDGKVTLNSSDFANGAYFTIAAPVPKLENAALEQAQAGDNQITLTFDRDIELTNGTGFTITVDGNDIANATFTVDPTDAKKVIITLPDGTEVTGKEVKVSYDATQGNLKGQNGVSVSNFDVSIVNKELLQAKVDEAAGLIATEYTPETWANYQNQLIAAKNVLDDLNATQEEVNQALAALTDAQDKLVLVGPKPETAKLEQTTNGNKITVAFDKDITLTDLTGFAIDVDGVEVVPTGFEVVDGKLVLTFPKTPDVTGKSVTVKYDGTGTLEGTNGAKVAEFNKAAENPYSAAFQITQPDAVTTNPHPTFGGKVAVTTTPSTVTIELKNSNNDTILVDGIATVDPLTGEWTFTPPTDLPDGMYTIVATATDGQQVVTKTKTFTISTTPAVNKIPLQNKVDESNNLVPTNYTPESWTLYNEALQKAKEVLANPNATQTEVNNALVELTAAQNKLVPITPVGQGLNSLTPSTGTLSPSFQTGVTDYTMNVGYPTSTINFNAIPMDVGAKVTTTVNGQPGTLGQIPLRVGENIILITVTDANGNVKQYTIKVYRQANTSSPGSGDNGNTDGGTTTPTPEQPQENKTIIRVDLEVDGDNPLEKTTVEIERTTHADGQVTDLVNLTPAQALEAVEKAKKIGNTIARIVIPDVKDEVDKVTVEVPKESLKILRDNGLTLEIATDNAHIAIPNSSMEGVEDNFYFRLVPVKKESERQAIEERARAERVVRETLQSNNVHVVARPMTIETNLPSRPVVITLPLRGVTLPTEAAERQAFLESLAVFIEHSDGEKKVVQPEVVTMQDGKPGLRFTVEKFSTFTIIQVTKEVQTHTAYIRGFEDGTFRPEENITRAQAARMIARILGYEEGTTVDTAPFKDIPSTHFAAGEIAYVKEMGIMDGDEKGNFNASNNITRAQMAKVVANFKKLTVEENITLTFNDTKGHWAQWIIEANRDAGIISGYPDGRFAPNEAITRVQAVRMINRMLERGPLNELPTASFTDVSKTHRAFGDIEEAARTHSYTVDANGVEQFVK
ncbi:S-layer homology domain-containing protein [Bacillus ndiopicus]|uniref:S-layer homology domain-containing protein n=1 Tax=Bacillus ndiopicus TaxID=1347368 RepID=UPI000694CEC5|nr:S-layer homology domain-containing protein [Bacillus ndiopicus]